MPSHTLLFIFLIPFFALSPACHRAGGESPKKGEADKGPPPVSISLVEQKTIPRAISIIAELKGIEQVDVFSKFVGKISFIGPKEGQQVKQGGVLFRIDRNDPGETYLNAPILSPITGWVGHWNVLSVGEQVNTGDAIVTMVDDSALRATIYLPLDKWMLIRKETKVRVMVGGEQRDGKVTVVARTAESGSGRGSAMIETANPNHSWRAGMVANITLDLDPRQRIVISAKALSITDQGAFVYIVEDGKAKRQKVKFEVVDADNVEITEGLGESNQLVIAGGNLISDGRPVKIVGESQAKGH